ncbi:hypothetical protein LTR37_002300 [Vermiconidia calcicola]|uniref:Uncharacterized protein n=1 Tax=Vermiconidia calcicola TaxID=1690605 RepID=A0ACC3NT94_9PEZI|nr:hypothetical protein LTR37_002300 [Vermiconidia calcicola]
MDDKNAFTNPDDYWRLKDYRHWSVKEMRKLLEERNYDAGSVKDAETLRCHLQRSELGLPSYKKLSNAELREIIRERGIATKSTSGNKGGRGELLDLLRAEDRCRTFPKFTKLPGELRSRIYGYYFASFTRPLHAPRQPPITLTNSLVRKETLPLFYSTFTFDLNLLLHHSRQKARGQSRFLKMRADTRGWLQCARAENLADIQHIRVSIFPEDSYRMSHDDTLFTFSVDHSKVEKMTVVRKSTSKWGRLDTGRLMGRVHNVLDLIKNRNGGWRIEEEDFFALRRAVELSLA